MKHFFSKHANQPASASSQQALPKASSSELSAISASTLSTIIKAYGYSDIGRTRPNNEDVWVSFLQQKFFAIADGIGGHKAGEIAAKQTINYLSKSVVQLSKFDENTSVEKICAFLLATLQYVNELIYRMGTNFAHLRGMGTTLACLYLHYDKAIFANVGDSRIYRFRKNSLTQLTQDHSLIDKKNAEKKDLHLKNIITRAIGAAPVVTPNLSYTDIQIGDIFFLCTDGLSDYIKDEEISIILQSSSSLESRVENLIEQAKKNKSPDNITLGLVEVESFHANDKKAHISR